MTSAAYYRAWRAAHPAYRARQNGLSKVRRLLNGRGDRSAEYARRRRAAERLDVPIAHPLLDRARGLVSGHPDRRSTLVDPLYDDLIGVAVLALVEGTDAPTAIRGYAAAEKTWRRSTRPLFQTSEGEYLFERRAA